MVVRFAGRSAGWRRSAGENSRRMPDAGRNNARNALGARHARRSFVVGGPRNETVASGSRADAFVAGGKIQGGAGNAVGRFPGVRSSRGGKSHGARRVPENSLPVGSSGGFWSAGWAHDARDAHRAAGSGREIERQGRRDAGDFGAGGDRMTAVKQVHVIGIGGSAMAPLAGMLRENGYRVTGSRF